MELDDKEKVEPEGPEEDEKYQSFFEVDETEDWDEDLEEEEVRQKIKEHKLKSVKERKRTGEKSEGSHRRMHRGR